MATGSLAHTTPGFLELTAETAYDLPAAQRILDEAGWVPGADGIRVKNGQRLSFEVTFSQAFAGNQAILELLQQQVRAAGIDIRLGLVANAEYTVKQNSKDFDAIYYNVTRADGDIVRTNFGLDGRNLNARGPIPALDTALSEQLGTVDKAERTRFIEQAQRLLLSEGLWIPTIELSQAIGVANTVQDLKFEASARLQFYDTWLSGR